MSKLPLRNLWIFVFVFIDRSFLFSIGSDLMLIPILFLLSLVVIIDVQSYTRVFDVIVILYTIAAIVAIGAYLRFRKKEENGNEERKYVLKKKAMTWKRKYCGKWDKLTRVGLAEFMIFHGAPAFVANMNKDANFSLIILSKDEDENIISISAVGFPAVEGVFAKAGATYDDAEEFETKDPSKRPIAIRSWFDEESKELRTKVVNKVTNITMDQIRRIDDDDVLHVKVTATKPDGTSVSWEATLKRSK